MPNNPFDNQNASNQPKKSNTWLWVLGIVGGVFLIGAIICCGLVYFAASKGSEFVAEAVIEEVRDNPVILENIGEVTESSANLSEAWAESTKEENIATLVIDVKGDKGSGKIYHSTNNATQELSVKLVMDDGSEFPIEMTDEYDEELDELGDALDGLEEMEATDNAESLEDADVK